MAAMVAMVKTAATMAAGGRAAVVARATTHGTDWRAGGGGCEGSEGWC